MTSSSVSVQGLTYQITCVSLENCLTSGVHLTSRRGHPRVDPPKRLCLQQKVKKGRVGQEIAENRARSEKQKPLNLRPRQC
jgi:hypothetical protein